MSTDIDQQARKEIRLESWQEQPPSRKMGAFSEKESMWMVNLVRREIDSQITFEICFLKSGERAFDWVVPSEAHNYLAKVFLQGGSFLKETMKHMKEKWELAKDIHPHFFALYEQQIVLPEATSGAQPPSSPNWVRL